MKNGILYIGLMLLVFSACTTTSKLATHKDDVYYDPVKDKQEEIRLAAEQKKKELDEQVKEDQRQQALIAQQRERENNNPYYKDPEFKADDYYDYEYASRLKRFDNTVYGLGYYDNWYTNTYWYSGNPEQYGSSIYSSSNWCNPYSNFNSYNNGFGGFVGYGYNNGWTLGSSFNSPYGYNSFYNNYYGSNNSYWNGYYNGFNNGYYSGMNGFSNPYNNGWGYFNSYDQNSYSTYAPRTSHSGGNSERVANPKLNYTNGFAQLYFDNTGSTPEQNQKFTPIKFNKPISSSSDKQLEKSGVYIRDANTLNDKPYTTPSTTRGSFDNAPSKSTSTKPSIFNGNETPVKQNGTYTTTPRSETTKPSVEKIEKSEYKQQRSTFETPTFSTPSNNNSTPSRPAQNSNNSGGARPR